MLVASLGEYLLAKLEALRPSQMSRLERILDAWLEGAQYTAHPDSDFATEEFCAEFGDILREHHNSSGEAFSKDKFEFGLRRALAVSGHDAQMAPPGNPGEDLIVDGAGWSCKTEAHAQIKVDRLHISKFMELGRGEWITVQDIEALRERMFSHMRAYDRILVLRKIRGTVDSTGETAYIYEIVEIPKSLLLRSRDFAISIKDQSRQNPKPAVCVVTDRTGNRIFQLYFDGGTERKLQIQHIRKDVCVVHATWSFTTT